MESYEVKGNVLAIEKEGYMITSALYAVAASVADVRREPDPTSELVTQALLNTPAASGETRGDWTHVRLPDYDGWMHTHDLADSIVKGFCKVGENCSTPLSLVAVTTITHTPLYSAADGEETTGHTYLSTALPLLDTTHPRRVQVALPGEREAWLDRSAIAVRQQADLYPRQPLSTITDYAHQFLGVPYLWGGTSWEGIDCSSFVQLCYRMGGYTLPRDGDQQYDFLTTSVERNQMREGDLLFFGSASITHVALALNDHEYIHAEGANYHRVLINSFIPTDPHYYKRLDEIVWGLKRVIV